MENRTPLRWPNRPESLGQPTTFETEIGLARSEPAWVESEPREASKRKSSVTEARAEVTGCAIFENSTVCQIVDDFVPVFVAAFGGGGCGFL